MSNTKASQVITKFQSIIMNKYKLPDDLMDEWLDSAIAAYGLELSPLNYNSTTREFGDKLDEDNILILSLIMKRFYQDREVSRVNKGVSVVGKDISFDGMGNNKKYANIELLEINASIKDLIDKKKPSAYV